MATSATSCRITLLREFTKTVRRCFAGDRKHPPFPCKTVCGNTSAVRRNVGGKKIILNFRETENRLNLSLWTDLSRLKGKGRSRFSAEFLEFDALVKIGIVFDSALPGNHSSGDHRGSAGPYNAEIVEDGTSGRQGSSEKVFED